jgi:hypothetical protein
LLALLAAGVAGAPPARADVVSVSPSSRTVPPGGTTTATVTVQASSTTCVDGRESSDAVRTSFSPECDDEPRWTSTMTVQAPTTPGTYTVEIGDNQSSSTQRFTLTVSAPATTTTAPATTTTAPPAATTTTAPAGSTTTAPTTTTAPAATTTTAPPGTTTTLAPPPPGGGFVTVASLVAAGVPDEGVFLPLTSPGFRNCLPLTEACVDPESALVLVPARTTEVTWRALGADERTSPKADLRGLDPLSPVGVAPADPGAQDYSLPILDLTAPGGQVRSLVRGLDDQGRLVTPRVSGAVAAPTAEGPSAAPDATTFLASAPFGKPRLATKADLSEAAPAIALFSSTSLQVLYAVRPDPSWGLNVALLPLLGDGAVPYLVQGVDGPPGLYVPRPDGLRIPKAGSEDATGGADGDGGGGGVSPLLLLGAAVLVAAALTVGLTLRRR